MALPEEIKENDIEDIQTIELDLQALVDKYVKPIEQFRSAAAPAQLLARSVRRNDFTVTGITQALSDELNRASFDPSEAQESRAHCFYRMIGLPVMDSNGLFYNPGFNPRQTDKELIANARIANGVPTAVTELQTRREFSARNRKAYFKRAGLDASIFAVAMSLIPKTTFQIIDTALGPQDLDPQTYTLTDRKQIQTRYTDLNGNELTKFFESGTHILRPFLVDPTIAETVMPEQRLICQPFLNEAATRIEKNKELLRPVIEFVLRLRLRQSPTDASNIAGQVILSLDNNADITGLSQAELKQLSLALLDENKVDGQQVNRLYTTPFDIVQLNKFVKTIKGLIKKLVDAVEEIFDISRNIPWTPLPGDRGPEFPSDLTFNGLLIDKVKNSELEKRIQSLTIKAQNSERQGNARIATEKFALSMYENVEKNFQADLDEAKDQRNDFVTRGAQALATIEYITGEVSGLGLIDILSIYTALWAIDLNVLISLLDNSAFERLYEFNPDLRNTQVQIRRDGGPAFGGLDALDRFESQVISILSFAESEFEKQLSNPVVGEGGEPPREQ